MNYPTLPLFPGETIARCFNGLSGSPVYLVQSSSNALFVRKAAVNADVSLRLEQQFKKLSTFQKCSLPGVASPKILEATYYQGYFYMDLEYISGLDLIEYSAITDVSQLRKLGEQLGDFIIEMGKYPCVENPPGNVTQVFYNKTFSLVEKCPWLSDKLKVELFLSIKNVTQLMEGKSSLCHGDLTFENILIDKNGQIWLIDHLDSFCPFYWQDIAKLHQDLSGEWFRFRRPNACIPKYALAHLSNCILEKICESDPSYYAAHYGLLAFVFARILPYTTTHEIREFVISRLSHYLNLSLAERPLVAC